MQVSFHNLHSEGRTKYTMVTTCWKLHKIFFIIFMICFKNNLPPGMSLGKGWEVVIYIPQHRHKGFHFLHNFLYNLNIKYIKKNVVTCSFFTRVGQKKKSLHNETSPWHQHFALNTWTLSCIVQVQRYTLPTASWAISSGLILHTLTTVFKFSLLF